jgi:acetyl-CoA carboxylase biotin carboxyl carrier protein
MMDLKKLEKVMELMQKYGVSEVEFDEKGLKTRVSFASSQAPAAPVFTAPRAPLMVHHEVQAAAAQPSAEASAKPAAKSNLREIRSPFVGTFYEAASPGAEAFVKIGKKISTGDVLCIVEAMKLMNEIEAEESGTVVEILVKNGQPVEFNQVLFLIE